jgi:hypothetical protein
MYFCVRNGTGVWNGLAIPVQYWGARCYICMSSGCGHGGFNLMRTAMARLETKDDKEISYKGLEKREERERKESEREPSARNS